jgi:hypothetical protein
MVTTIEDAKRQYSWNKSRNDEQQVINRLETSVEVSDNSLSSISIALSLKRIADTLDSIARTLGSRGA